jgi:hypothetical protein
MDHDTRIEAAITELESQDRINFSVTATKWDLERTTLVKRFRGETGQIETPTHTHVDSLRTYKKKLLLSTLISLVIEVFHQPLK